MIKVMLANRMDSYKAGKSDGLTFTNVEEKDLDILQKLSAKYNKEISIIRLSDISTDIKEETPIKIDKRKIKKVFITNGIKTIKITPDLLQEYMAKGYRTGRK